MNLIQLIAVILLVAILFGAFPLAPWTATWGLGWYPSAAALVLLVLLLIFIL
jgi:hypothetical protein